MAISKRLRYEILRRDGHRCKYCGRAAPEVKLTVDHVVPETLGGTDKPDNLVAACSECNSGKSATPPDAPLIAGAAEDQVRWALAMNTVVEQRAAELRAQRKRLAKFDKAWRGYHNSAGEEIPRDVNWKNSVSRFMGFGLDDEFLIDATATAMGSPKPSHDAVWRYFCGICWREIEEMQASAANVLAAQPRRYPGLAPDEEPESAEMPLMEAFNTFLERLLEEVPGAETATKIAQQALWEAMPEADRIYRGACDYWPVKDGERTEAMREALGYMLIPAQKDIAAAIREAAS